MGLRTAEKLSMFLPAIYFLVYRDNSEDDTVRFIFLRAFLTYCESLFGPRCATGARAGTSLPICLKKLS